MRSCRKENTLNENKTKQTCTRSVDRAARHICLLVPAGGPNETTQLKKRQKNNQTERSETNTTRKKKKIVVVYNPVLYWGIMY